jgi:hypothetical protein
MLQLWTEPSERSPAGRITGGERERRYETNGVTFFRSDNMTVVGARFFSGCTNQDFTQI